MELKPSSDRYKQTLVRRNLKVIKEAKLKELNRKKAFEYGYNEEFDFVCISKDGTVGEILKIQGLRIGLPQQPKKSHSRSDKKEEQYWEELPKPSDIKKIKDIKHFGSLPESRKAKYAQYIEDEFKRRVDGFWFMKKGEPTYITGSHYFYLQWAKIDVGSPQYREPNRLFYIFWEACKADHRCFGMCYLKNRRSGFSFMASSEAVNLASMTRKSRYGVLSKTGDDAKKMFTGKIVPMSLNLPFFFKPIQSGEEKPKSELVYAVPSERLTKKKLRSDDLATETLDGLDTTIDWKTTGDNSYDGEKLQLLVHDESGKWEKPNKLPNNWTVTKTCLRLGDDIIGKCMMGSTSNKLSKGGEEFKKMYKESDLTETKRDGNGRTPTGLYSMFIPMEWNYEGFFDLYGDPVFNTPEKPVLRLNGDPNNKRHYIKKGVIETWNDELEGLKDNQNSYNEHLRQYPRTEKHAFRDEAQASLFNLNKIYEQIDFNETLERDGIVRQGSFMWENGMIDTTVRWVDRKDGRFKISWLPPHEMTNQYRVKGSLKVPMNDHLGAFGCDPYDIAGTVDGRISNGALHGVTGFHLEQSIPVNYFFLQYIARPQTAEIFFEDVLMACVFYGMPILIENNKPRILFHFAQRGYRGYSIDRPDRNWGDMSKHEKALGGIPNNSESVKQAHAAAIETYIEDYVGVKESGEMGQMYFTRTLEDWAKFDINNRTRHDASISSGLALMAIKKNLYKPIIKKNYKPLGFSMPKFDNSGLVSKRNNNNYGEEHLNR